MRTDVRGPQSGPSIVRKTFDLYAAGHRLSALSLTPAETAADSPVLVFLHEGLGSVGQWRDFPDAVCASTCHPVLVYERWGYGNSDPLNAPRTPRYLHDEAFISLPEVLKQCKIENPVFVGHSDGGSIALIYAGRNPGRTRGIITEAAHVFVEDATLEGIKRAVEVYETTDLKERLAKFHGSNTDSMFRGWADTWLSPAFRNWNIEEYLPAITCPVLAIQGKDDEYGTPAQVAAIASQVSGPAVGCMIDNCGHIPHIQAGEKVLEEMVNFIHSLMKS
ncbi:MAG TPA: alpha/beta hydrolase [Syntrophales bacterium]|nr:alpha/beta hydrolase [Syntrophales bacterium]